MELPFLLQLTDFEISMLKSSSVDLLLHDRGSLNCPLMAVETDGKPHLNLAQQRKDKVKHKLLQMMGIPLIRISEVDTPYLWVKQDAKKHGEKLSPSKQRQLDDDLKNFGIFFGGLAMLICGQVRRANKQAIALHNAKIELCKVEDKFSRSLYGKEYVELNEQQKDCVDKSSLEADEATAYYDAYKLDADFADQELQLAKERSAWPIDLQRNTTASELSGNLTSGLRARVGLTTPKLVTIQIATPIIQLRAVESINPQLLDANVRQALSRSLEHKARDHLRAHSS